MRHDRIIIFVLVCFAAVQVYSQSLSISIEAHKPTLVLGEPLYITVRIENTGQQLVSLIYGNSPSYELGQGWGRILIAKGDKDLGSWSDQLRPLEKVAALVVDSGQTITNEYVILYSHPGAFAFQTPGNYRITIEYLIKHGQSIQGNPILITVLEPEGEDALMWEKLEHDRGYGFLIQVPWDTRIDRAIIENLIAVYDQNVTCVYKQYLGLGIGRYYMIGNEDSLAALFLQSANTNTDNETLRKMISREIEIINQRTLQAQVTLKPEALKVSPGILTAFVRLPDGYPISGITSATCDGAPSERMMPNEDGTEMIIKFRRKDIEAMLGQIGQSLDTTFIVRGTWQAPTGIRLFQGTASIKKIVGAKEKKK